MIRTQVYLTEEQHRRLNFQAKEERKSFAETLRDAIEEGLSKKTKGKNAGFILLQMAKKAVKGGGKDGSKNIDHELYEEV